MDDAVKKLKQLEESNRKLQQTVTMLMRRLAAVEKRADNAYHTARTTENRMNSLHSKVQLQESKVTRVEDILRRH